MDRLEKLVELRKEQGDEPFVLFALAKEYEKLQDMENCHTFYELLIEKHPYYVGTYYHYAALQVLEGQLAKALKTYERGIGIAQAAGDLHAVSELKSAKLNLEIRE